MSHPKGARVNGRSKIVMRKIIQRVFTKPLSLEFTFEGKEFSAKRINNALAYDPSTRTFLIGHANFGIPDLETFRPVTLVEALNWYARTERELATSNASCIGTEGCLAHLVEVAASELEKSTADRRVRRRANRTTGKSA